MEVKIHGTDMASIARRVTFKAHCIATPLCSPSADDDSQLEESAFTLCWTDERMCDALIRTFPGQHAVDHWSVRCIGLSPQFALYSDYA